MEMAGRHEVTLLTKATIIDFADLYSLLVRYAQNYSSASGAGERRLVGPVGPFLGKLKLL